MKRHLIIIVLAVFVPLFASAQQGGRSVSLIPHVSGGYGGFIEGSYINGSHGLSADPNNSDFQHEYGHYLQSQEMGFAYLNRVGLPSLLSFHDHRFHPIEQDANRRAFLYFNKFVEGFYKSEEDKYNDYGWNFRDNPLNINNTYTYGQYVDYYNSNSLELLNDMTIHAKWYDYLFWRKTPYGPILSGLINAIYYNYQY